MKHLCASISDLCILAMLVTMGMVFLPVSDAMAQSATGLGSVQSNIAVNVINIPKLIALVSYVVAAFFTASGLVKLKDWINDSEKNPLNAALFRIVVASLLITFPHVWVIVSSSLFGDGAKGGIRSVEKTDAVKAQPLNAFK